MNKKALHLITLLNFFSPTVYGISVSQMMDLQNLAHVSYVDTNEKLTDKKEDKLLKSLYQWHIERNDVHKLRTTFELKSKEAADASKIEILELAYMKNIHITLFQFDKTLHVEIYNPEVVGLTENDFIFAARITALIILEFRTVESKNDVQRTKTLQKLTDEQEKFHLSNLYDWKVSRLGVHLLTTTFEFRNEEQAEKYMHQVKIAAFEKDINVDMLRFGNKVHIEIYTPEVRGLTENDFIFASRITTLKVLEYKS